MTGPSNGEELPARPTEWDPGRRPADPVPPTSIDPGRVPPAGDTPAGGVPPTTIDAGRVGVGRAVPGVPLTSMDPGRVRPWTQPDGSGATRDSAGVGLPPTLAARFELRKELRRGAEADVYVVQERATEQTWVLKLYEPTWVPDDRVWAYLRSGRTSKAVVETVEVDRADGRCYELMEFLPGDHLEKLRRDRSLEELGPDRLRAIVEQLVDAIDELHANGIVHRDLKPTNIVVRKLAPIEIAVVDFGISSPAGQDVQDRNGTPPYISPQFLAAGTVEPPNDMWALGISLIEFFTGARIYEDLKDPIALRSRVVSAPISTAAVTDERLRMLCTGLTAPGDRPRWGSKQIRAWLAGGFPPVPGYPGTIPTERPGGAEEPYRFGEAEYRFPDELATAMTMAWRDAASWLFTDDPSELKRLRRWLRQFPDVAWPERRLGAREPNDVRLLRVLRAMHPTHPPIHRSRHVSMGSLPALAKDAFEGVGDAPSVVGELSRYDLLPLLARGRETPKLEGGDRLGSVAEDWRAECDRLARGVAGLPEDVRAAQAQREGPAQLLAVGLLAATATEEIREKTRRDVQRAARRARASDGDLGWFAELADRRGALWLAFLALPDVDERIERIAAEAENARIRRDWLMRTQAVREWSRRQNRPQALAWSVAGLATLTAVSALLIGLSDVVDISSDATIVAAWLVMVLGLAVVLAGESLLAWEIGGSFHPRYSLLGAGRVQRGRAARSVLARRAALPVVLVVLGGLAAAAVFVPVLMAAAPAVLVPFWAWRRFARWEDDRVREQAEIEQAESARQDELSRARERVA